MSNEDRMPWPKYGMKLFIDHGEYHECSHFGWGCTETQFYGYIHGYQLSADELIDRLSERNDLGYLDTIIYPVMFLYRQFIELSLKQIYFYYSREDAKDKIKRIQRTSHDLIAIWKEVKIVLIEASDCRDDKESIETVENYIMQFSEIDNSSFRFRYPVNKQFEQTVEKQQKINLSNLKSRMTELGNFFDAATSKLAHMREYEADAMEYYRETMW